MTPLDTSAAVAQLLDYSHEDHARFRTGWSLDDTCGTVGTGEMALMWARSSAGKSTWYLNVIRNSPDVPTLVVNMEMTPRRQVDWLVPMTFDLETPGRYLEEVLRQPDHPNYDEARFSCEQLAEVYQCLHFVQPSRPRVDDLRVLLDDIEDSTGTRPKRVFVDHLTLMDGTEDYRGVVTTTADLHSWALADDIALYVLQQVGRGGGDQGRNDGHLPITFSSGVYGGEADADWIYGLYRPDRDPRFKRNEHSFSDRLEWFAMRDQYDKVRGQTILQVIKNRPFSEVCEDGITLTYDAHSRRLSELGGVPT